MIFLKENSALRCPMIWEWTPTASDDMGMDSDGNMMMRVGDNMAMDMDSGELHMVSGWDDDNDHGFHSSWDDDNNNGFGSSWDDNNNGFGSSWGDDDDW